MTFNDDRTVPEDEKLSLRYGTTDEALKLIENANAALECRLDEAVAGYREALSRYRSIGADFNVAMLALDFVIVVGGDHPATRDAAAEARTIFERVKARPYLERLDAEMARHAPDAQPTGVSP